MSDFTHALEAYQRVDPAGWVALYRVIPMGLGLLLAAVGLFLLLFGSERAVSRVVALPLGVAVGFFIAPVLVEANLKLGLTAGQIALISAGVLGVLGFAFPPAAIFFAAGLPAGLLAGKLVGRSDYWMAFLPAFFVCGLLAALMHRHVAALLSSMVGAWALVLGLLAGLHQVNGISQTVAATPWAVIAAAGFFALAGAVFQLSRPPPEERAKKKQEQDLAKRKAAEQKALEKRWASYTDNRNR